MNQYRCGLAFDSQSYMCMTISNVDVGDYARPTYTESVSLANLPAFFIVPGDVDLVSEEFAVVVYVEVVCLLVKLRS